MARRAPTQSSTSSQTISIIDRQAVAPVHLAHRVGSIAVAGVGVRASVAIEVAGTILDGCVRVVVASRWLGAPCACQVLTRPIIIGRSGIVVAGVGVRASVAIEVAGTILDGCVRVVVASRVVSRMSRYSHGSSSVQGIVVAGVGVRASVAIEVAGTILDGCVRVVVAPDAHRACQPSQSNHR